MKKVVQFTGLLGLAIFFQNLTAQIPNAGFENWTAVGSYENPDGWATLNHTTAPFSLFTATKATPGSPGSSYLKLTSKTIGGSLVPGIAVSGKLDTLTMMPVSGVPYTLRPASLSGKWQHMIYGNSQGSIMAILTKWNAAQAKRDTIAHALQDLSGMAMSWANFGISLVYKDSLQYPDSCMIVLRASGNAPTNNDYLWVDNFAFTGSVAVAPPPNLVSLKENSKDAELSIFPNPSGGHVTLTYNLASDQNVSIRLLDVTGKLVKEIVPASRIIGKNSVGIETKNLPKGIYSVVIQATNSVATKKLVIQ